MIVALSFGTPPVLTTPVLESAHKPSSFSIVLGINCASSAYGKEFSRYSTFELLLVMAGCRAVMPMPPRERLLNSAKLTTFTSRTNWDLEIAKRLAPVSRLNPAPPNSSVVIYTLFLSMPSLGWSPKQGHCPAVLFGRVVSMWYTATCNCLFTTSRSVWLGTRLFV